MQHRLNVMNDAAEMLAVCDEFNLASINKAPLSSGFLTESTPRPPNFPPTMDGTEST